MVADPAGCPDIYAPIPVNRGGVVSVKTPHEATRVLLSAQRPSSPSNACVEREAGRWRCLMPASAGVTLGALSISYPGAGSSWTFQIKPQSPDSH